MANYKEMYYQLFNEITDIIERLKEIQQEMEDIHSNADEKDTD